MCRCNPMLRRRERRCCSRPVAILMASHPPLSKDQVSTLSFRLGEQDDFAFSEELQKAVFAALPSKDPLDDPSFNAVDFINGLFPDGTSWQFDPNRARKPTPATVFVLASRRHFCVHWRLAGGSLTPKL